MLTTKIKIFIVTYVNFGLILNVAILIIRLGVSHCDESWYCIESCSTIFSFNAISINSNFLVCYTSTDSNIMQWKDLENDHNISLILKSSPNSELLVNQFNNPTL